MANITGLSRSGMKMECFGKEGEFDRGQLVQFSIMEGKPFDSKEIIDITDPSDEAMIQLLFNE